MTDRPNYAQLAADMEWEAAALIATHGRTSESSDVRLLRDGAKAVRQLAAAPDGALAVEWQVRIDATLDGTWNAWTGCSQGEYEARLAILAGRSVARMAGSFDYGTSPLREDKGGWPTQVRALYTTPPAPDTVSKKAPPPDSYAYQIAAAPYQLSAPAGMVMVHSNLLAAVRRVDKEMWANGTSGVSYPAMKALSRALEQQDAAAPAAQVDDPVCSSCRGKGYTDGYGADGSYDAVPCGDCAPAAAPAVDEAMVKCNAWSCNGGRVVGPYDTPMICGKCGGAGSIPALSASPAAQVAADGPAVGWRVRVLHHPHGMAPFWSRWQDIDAKTFAETKATGAYFEYETFELQELGVLAAAPAVVVDEAEGYYLASFKRPQPGAPVVWWGPDNAGYTTNLQDAGIYTELKPGYHDSEHTVPVPVSFVRGLRIRHEVDPGDSENVAFWNAEKLRTALAAALSQGKAS